jgi:hypothetical protein
MQKQIRLEAQVPVAFPPFFRENTPQFRRISGLRFKFQKLIMRPDFSETARSADRRVSSQIFTRLPAGCSWLLAPDS